MVRLANPATGTLAAGVTVQKTRQLTLNEVIGPPTTVSGVSYPGGPLEILVNNSELPGTDRPDFTPITVGGITDLLLRTTSWRATPRSGRSST